MYYAFNIYTLTLPSATGWQWMLQALAGHNIQRHRPYIQRRQGRAKFNIQRHLAHAAPMGHVNCQWQCMLPVAVYIEDAHADRCLFCISAFHVSVYISAWTHVCSTALLRHFRFWGPHPCDIKQILTMDHGYEKCNMEAAI